MSSVVLDLQFIGNLLAIACGTEKEVQKSV
jgi:hypothetical protein